MRLKFNITILKQNTNVSHMSDPIIITLVLAVLHKLDMVVRDGSIHWTKTQVSYSFDV